MSLVLLLLLSLSALLRVESSRSAQQLSQVQARQNALLGLQIAVGQLQRHAGPDQRVTAPATVAYPDADTVKNFYVNRAVNRSGFRTFLDPTGRAAFHDDLKGWWSGGRAARWTGVWNSERTDGRPDRNQLPVWLVSGNEGWDPASGTYPVGYWRPDTVLDDPAINPDVVWLVGTASAADASNSADGFDGRVKVSRQAIGEPGDAAGHFAYWVGDESVKANIALRDPFFEESNPASVDYRNRLLSPQRTAWEQMSAFAAAGAGAMDPDDPRLDKLTVARDIVLLDEDLADAEVDQKHFHEVTLLSKGLFTDTARGGLRRNLTDYFETGTGLNNSDPIADPVDYQGDLRMGNANTGFPATIANIPTWGQLREWNANAVSGGSAGTVAVSADVGPVVTGFRLMVGFSYAGTEVRMHLLPLLTIWNPFDAALDETNYQVDVEMPIRFKDFSVASTGFGAVTTGVDPIGSSGYFRHELISAIDNSTAALQTFWPWAPASPAKTPEGNPNPGGTPLRFAFSAGFAKGESKVFTVLNNQTVINPDLAGNSGDAILIQVASGFDDDFPSSASFKLFDIAAPAPQAGEDVRFFLGVDEGATPKSHPRIEISTGAYSAAWEDFGFYEPGFIWQNAARGQLSGNKQTSHENLRDSQPLQWRILPAATDFQSSILGLDDTFAINSPIFNVAHSYLAPFTIPGFRTHRIEEVQRHYRAFANYNLNAQDLGLHPLAEKRRSLNTSSNSDKFPRLQVAQSRVFGSGGMSNAQSVSWDDRVAEASISGAVGFSLVTPFFESPNNEYRGLDVLPLRAVRRAQAELLSIGQMQQANLSPFFWQPTFPIGNAEASPYVDRELMAGIESRSFETGSGVRTVPNDPDNYSVDLSYLLNDALWDSYFLTGKPTNVSGAGGSTTVFPNGRIQALDGSPASNGLVDFDDSAQDLLLVGAFNVNSTSVEAWKALLFAFRDLAVSGPSGQSNPAETVPVSRTLNPQEEPVDIRMAGDIGASSSLRDYARVLTGFRFLNDTEIETLSERIVDEVILRGPFLSIGDFVNRRLVAPERASGTWSTARTDSSGASLSKFMSAAYDSYQGMAGINGTIQRAINIAGINGGVNDRRAAGLEDTDRVLGIRGDAVYTNDNTPFFINYPTTHYYLDSEHLAGAPAGENGQLMSHAAGFVTQGDLLSMIGSALTARGDTFLIRSYGDVVNPATGRVDGRVWLEATVQRVPQPVVDTDGDFEPNNAFGRRFEIVSMRWLGEGEI